MVWLLQESLSQQIFRWHSHNPLVMNILFTPSPPCNGMTFGNLLESCPSILLRAHLYLFGSLQRIAFDYSLLKVKRNRSRHKSFLISCSESLPRVHCIHGQRLIWVWCLSPERLWTQKRAGVGPQRATDLQQSSHDKQVGKGLQICHLPVMASFVWEWSTPPSSTGRPLPPNLLPILNLPASPILPPPAPSSPRSLSTLWWNG